MMKPQTLFIFILSETCLALTPSDPQSYLSKNCIALLSNYILIPMANFGLLLAEMGVEVPSLDMSAMMPVLLGMLGLGAMRTVEFKVIDIEISG